MKHEPKVSLIILTYNSGQTIGRCLEGVTKLDYPRQRLEVIVLDNGSNDTTVATVENHGYRCISLPEMNLSELRNHGADIGNGEIIAYVDSDCIVAENWLQEVVKWFVDPSVGIVGNEYQLPDNPTVFESNWYNTCNKGIKEDDLIPAGNMAIKKEYFTRLGGFDNTLQTGEDDYILDLFRHNTLRTISDHRIRSKHLGNAKNLRQYYRKETWYGLGMLGTLHLAKLNKPLIATICFSVSLVSCLVFLLWFLLSENTAGLYLSGTALCLGLLLPILSALDRVYRKKRKGNILYVSLVFTVFFLARTKSLLLILSQQLLKSTR